MLVDPSAVLVEEASVIVAVTERIVRVGAPVVVIVAVVEVEDFDVVPPVILLVRFPLRGKVIPATSLQFCAKAEKRHEQVSWIR